MTTVLILLGQLLTMLFFMAIGFALYKGKLITKTGSKEFGSLLLWVILPCVIINAFSSEKTPEKMAGLAWSFVFSFMALLLAMAIAQLAFGTKHRIENFGAAFSNAGFMGIPLIKAVLGVEAVFYISSFVALLNILQWTYGVWLMTGSRESIRFRKLITNPIIISFAAAVTLFVTQIKLPATVSSGISTISNMNGPVAMIVLGVYLAQVNLRDMITDRQAYFCSVVRLILIPLATIALMMVIPENYSAMKLAILIAAAAPVGSNVALYAQQNGMSYTDAVKSVCLSTAFCVVTIPVIICIAVKIM